ncbi:hypothetical protein PIB30_094587 [Stylosanthes scabra]|uniref:Uncharacterized protein n=1 Tax=Stylosanthes scabra TaxID=79078 RepID=A0ABU6TV49_9FABA|nr:hypothetical protein [Stylosanthes scabra]
MDKKGKTTIRQPVSKIYAKQAVSMNLAASKLPPTSSPNIPKSNKKEPIVIDLTTDSESEEKARQRSHERKIDKAFWRRHDAGNAAIFDSNQSPPSTTFGSSDDEEFLREAMEAGASDISFVGSFSGESSSSH